MQRKIILMGGKTHVVSLPAQWVKKLNLIKGQEIYIEERGSNLVVSASPNPKAKSTTIIYSPQRLLKAYQLGFDEIKVTDYGNISSLQSFINKYLLGIEITSSQLSYCILRSVSEINQKELYNMIKRALLLLSSENSKFNRDNALRLIYAAKRAISKFGQHSFEKSLILYNLLSTLEHSSDREEIFSLYEQFQKFEANKLKLSDNINEEFVSLALC